MAGAQTGASLSEASRHKLGHLSVKCVDVICELQKDRATIRQLYERIGDVLSASLDAVNAHLKAERLDTEVDAMLEAELNRLSSGLQQDAGAEQLDDLSALRFLDELVVSCQSSVQRLSRSSSRFSRLNEQKALVEIVDSNVRCAVPLRCVHSDGNLANALLAASIIGHRLDLFKQQSTDPAPPALVSAEALSAEQLVPVSPPTTMQSFSNMLKKVSSAAPAVRPRVSVQPVNYTTQPLRSLLPTPCRNPIYCLIIETQDDNHRVLVELNVRVARSLCHNFMKLCDSGLYNGSKFHHAIPGDQIHGGFIDKSGGRAANVTGSSRFITPELSPLKDQFGAIRMKGMECSYSSGMVNCQIGSQFFIWLSETRHYMERGSTLVFGRVIDGLAILDMVSRYHRPHLMACTVLFAGRFDGSH